MYGNLAEKGSVAKISGKEGERFEGSARVFDGEQKLIEGISSGLVKAGDVVVIKNEISKVLDHFSDKALGELLAFLKELDTKKEIKTHMSSALNKILEEDKDLLAKLAQ